MYWFWRRQKNWLYTKVNIACRIYYSCTKIKMTNDTGFLIFHINFHEWKIPFSLFFQAVCQTMIRDRREMRGKGWSSSDLKIFFFLFLALPISIPNEIGKWGWNMSHFSLAPLIKQSNRKQSRKPFNSIFKSECGYFQITRKMLYFPGKNPGEF